MYGRVKKHLCSGTRGEAIALLADLESAERKAGTTHDLTLDSFLPLDFWGRLSAILKKEAENITEEEQR